MLGTIKRLSVRRRFNAVLDPEISAFVRNFALQNKLSEKLEENLEIALSRFGNNIQAMAAEALYDEDTL